MQRPTRADSSDPFRLGSSSDAKRALVGVGTPWEAYVVAVLLPMATLAGRLAVGVEHQGEMGLELFVIPVLIAGFVGGLWPGILATVISALSTNYYVVNPFPHHFSVASNIRTASWGTLIVSGILISLINEALRRSEQLRDATVDVQESAIPSRLGFGYALIGVLWILLSDKALAWLVHDSLLFAQLSIVKGWGFVAVTALLLYSALRKQLLRLHKEAIGRRIAEETLRQRERHLQQTGSMAKIGGWEYDIASREVTWTEEVAKIYDVEPDYKPTLEYAVGVYHGESRERLDAALQAASTSGAPYDLELELITEKGNHKWVRTIGRPAIGSGGFVTLQGCIQDITAQKRVAIELERMGRLYKGLSELSQMIALATSETAVFKEACRIIVEAGGFKAAWLAHYDRSTDRIVPMASAGMEASPPRAFPFFDANHPGGRRPLLRTIREDRSYVCNDVRTDPETISIRTAALRAGFLSGASFPIRFGGNVYGALTVYAPTVDFFRDAEISLLEKLALGISYSLDHLAYERERSEAEAALRQQIELQEQLGKIAAMVPGVIASYRMSPKGKVSMPYVSDALRDLFGVAPSQVSEDILELIERIHPQDVSRLRVGMLRSAQTLTDWRAEYRIRHPEKGERWIESHCVPQQEEDGSTLWHGYAHDVTERKDSEIALRAGEERLETFFAHAPAALAMFDTQMRYILASRRWSTDFHLEGELRGRYHYDLVPDLPARWKEGHLRALRGEVLRSEADRFDRADGSVMWMRWEVRPFYDAPGKIGGILIFAEDITASYRSEELLRKSEMRFRELFVHSPVAYVSLDENGCFIDANDRLCKMLGYGWEELDGRCFSDLYSPATRAGFLEEFEQFRKKGEAQSDLELVRRDGTQITVLLEGRIQTDEQGHFVRTHCVLHDITERRRAEVGLRLQSAALNAAANAIVITDPRAVVEWVNPAFTAYTGYSVEEAVGKTMSELVKSGQHGPELYQDLWSTILAKRAWRGELVNRKKDGSLYSEQMSITPLLDDHGEISHFIGIKEDISERKRLEALVLRSQRLDSVGRLVSGIAHDLNNILTPILMTPGMLRSYVKHPRAETLLDMIETSAQRGASIIKQLLTFARGLPGERVPVQLRALVADMMRLIEQAFPKNITARQRVPLQVPLVNGDSTQLHQVLMNLCVNSRDAMPGGGTLTLSVEAVEVGVEMAKQNPDAQPGSYVVLSVEDTGSGIAPENLDKIYDPFFTTKTIGEGTGLGLSTALGIVKSHRGFIQVDSEVGRGTRFRIYLPAIARTSDATSEHPSKPPLIGGGELILVVDDEELTRQASRQVLEQHGYRVIEARNGDEGMALYSQYRQELRIVLTDLMMPVRDGIQLIRSLRSRYPGDRVQLMAMTGYLSQPELLDEVRHSVHIVLDKPLTGAALLDAVAAVLRARPI